VPIVHAVVGDVIITAVDHKPKATRALRRLDNIAGDPRVSVLFDSRSDDWTALWWVRADGVATIHDSPPTEAPALHARHRQYSHRPPEGPWMRIEVHRWTGWAAHDED
jgi:PPOX class probable F420-dependent enzyme